MSKIILTKRINKEILKTIIVENRSFILENKAGFVEIERFRLPSGNIESCHSIWSSAKWEDLYTLSSHAPEPRQFALYRF